MDGRRAPGRSPASPSRAAAWRRPVTIAVAAAMRAFGLVVRAGAPRRSQASSRTGQVAAHLLGDVGALLALGPAGEVRGVPRSGVHPGRHVEVGRAAVELEHLRRHPVEHVAVVGHQHAGRRGSRPATPPGSGWRRGRGGWSARRGSARRARSASSPASATRLAWPPDSSVVGASTSAAMPSRSSIASPAQPSPTASRTVPGGSTGDWSSTPTRTPASPTHRAGLGLQVAGEHPQQGGLARAVDPDDADAVAVVERQRHVGEQRSLGAGGGQPLGVEEDHGGGCEPGRKRAIARPEPGLAISVGREGFEPPKDDAG